MHDDFHDTLAKLRPAIGEMADALWLTALLDPTRSKDVHAVARAMAAELLGEDYIGRHILLEPPAQQQAGGELRLGWATYAGKPVCPFGLHDSELAHHIAILGRSGAGKSNIGYLLVWNLLRTATPFIVMDWRRNYGHFLSRPEGKRILPFRLGEPESLSFNPLAAPSDLTQSQREAYLRDVVAAIINAYLPGFHLLSSRGVEYFFLKALDELGGNAWEQCTFNDVKDYVNQHKTRSREGDWKASAQNILLRLTTGPTGRLFNSRGPPAVTDILEKPVILELDGLGSPTDRAAFTQCLLLWLFYHRLAEGRSRVSKHVLIVEEAHHLFSRRSSGTSDVQSSVLRQLRDLGQGLVLMDQNPSLLSTPALGNCGTCVVLNLRHGDDIEAAGKALASPRSKWDSIPKLSAGEAIVKVPDRFATPFLVRFPLFPVTDQPSRPCRRPDQADSLATQAQELQMAVDEAIRALRETDRRKNEEARIGEEERRLLLDIAEHPLSVVTERYTRLGWTAHTGTKIKRSLSEGGLVEQEQVTVPEGRVSLLRLTQAGRELLGSLGIRVQPLPKNAGLEHEYWKQRTAEDYRRRGYEVEEEVHIGGGKAIDLVATKNGKRTAIEIETGKSDAEANRRKCREAGFDEVLLFATRTRGARRAACTQKV